MRLLIASEYFPSTYKGYVDAQAARFIEMGAEVSFVACGRWGQRVDSRLAAVLPNPSITYLPPSPSRPGPFVRALFGAAMSPIRTGRLVRRLTDAFGWRKRTLGDAIRGVILGEPDVDVCLVHDLSTLVLLRALPVALSGVPIVLWYHGAEIPGSKKLAPADVRSALPLVRSVVTNTRWSAQHLASRGMPVERIHVHRLGIDVDDFPLVQRRVFRPDGVLRLLFVGRLSMEKGLFDALDALARLDEPTRSKVHFRVVGGGLVEDELARTVEALGLESMVTFVGRVERARLNGEFAAADLFLLPSRPVDGCEENQGMVVQEAMSTGLPVLTTAVGGLPEVVPPRIRELQTPPCSPIRLMERIVEFAEMPRERWDALSAEVAAYARREFEMARVTRPVFEHLAELAGE